MRHVIVTVIKISAISLIPVSLIAALVGSMLGWPDPVRYGSLLVGWLAFMCFAILALYGRDKEDER